MKLVRRSAAGDHLWQAADGSLVRGAGPWPKYRIQTALAAPARTALPGARYHVRRVGTMYTLCGRHVWDVDFVFRPEWFRDHQYPGELNPRRCRACEKILKIQGTASR